MNVDLLQENLLAALKAASRAAQANAMQWALRHVLIETVDDRLRITGTDLQLGISTWVGAKIRQEGRAMVPAKTLLDLVGKLSPERVTLSVEDDHTLHVRCGSTISEVRGSDPDDFPLLPDLSGSEHLVVMGDALADALGEVLFAAAKDGARPALCGVNVTSHADGLALATADGFRVAARVLPLEEGQGRKVEALVPASALKELARVLPDREEVLVALAPDRNLIVFQAKNLDVFITLFEGQFPDVENIFPREWVTRVVLYTADLQRACERAEVFAGGETHNIALAIQAHTPGSPDVMRVTGETGQRGKARSDIETTVTGEGVTVSFNVKYLLDFLKVVPDEQIALEINSPATPCLLRPLGRDTYRYIQMPVSVNGG